MIYDKLFKIQEEHNTFTKDAQNPFFKSDYQSLEGLMRELSPILTKHKLLVTHNTSDAHICTTVRDMGEKEISAVSSCTPLPEGIEPQKMGAAITYFKRYNLGQIFNIVTDQDDDGNASSPKNTKGKKAPTEGVKKIMEDLPF